MNQISAILLAGGLSSRMGVDKATLPFQGSTLLEWQLRKLNKLGIEDILLSGREAGTNEVRCVLDEFPRCGPLGGIHACLKQARFPNCLVISVDVPLVPERVLLELIEVHQRFQTKITILAHGSKWEPLIGVYDSNLWRDAEPILHSGSTAVRRLLQSVGFETFPCFEDDSLFCNCNTPQDYERLCRRTWL